MNTLKPLARPLLRFEVPILLALYLYFIFTDALPPAAFALILFLWGMRAWLARKISTRTPFDIPIILLLALLPFNLSISPDLTLSVPKIYGIILGVAFFYAIVNHISLSSDLSLEIFLLALLGLAIALAGLIGTDWAQSKIISASFIYDRLPRFIQGIPRSIAGGFARNGIGGTLTFTIPLLGALALARTWAKHSQERDSISSMTGTCQSNSASMNTGRMLRSYKYVVIAALMLSLITLALTQSRGGILGTMIGLLALIVWKKPRIGLGILIVGLFMLFALVSFGRVGLIANSIADGTLASRLEVWQRGWLMVQDFPFTGIGIGTYNVVAHTLYPFFIAAPDEVVPHAHNQFLEVAVDLGIPGLMTYLGLLAVFAYSAVRAYRAANDASVRALIMGLVCGMIAHHVFGLTDAFILGTKPGLLMWIYFAMAAAIYAEGLGNYAEPSLQGTS